MHVILKIDIFTESCLWADLVYYPPCLFVILSVCENENTIIGGQTKVWLNVLAPLLNSDNTVFKKKTLFVSLIFRLVKIQTYELNFVCMKFLYIQSYLQNVSALALFLCSFKHYNRHKSVKIHI